jgi:hypothetical protein
MLSVREQREFLKLQMIGCKYNFDENIFSADFEDIGDELIGCVHPSEDKNVVAHLDSSVAYTLAGLGTPNAQIALQIAHFFLHHYKYREYNR